MTPDIQRSLSTQNIWSSAQCFIITINYLWNIAKTVDHLYHRDSRGVSRPFLNTFDFKPSGVSGLGPAGGRISKLLEVHIHFNPIPFDHLLSVRLPPRDLGLPTSVMMAVILVIVGPPVVQLSHAEPFVTSSVLAPFVAMPFATSSFLSSSKARSYVCSVLAT